MSWSRRSRRNTKTASARRTGARRRTSSGKSFGQRRPVRARRRHLRLPPERFWSWTEIKDGRSWEEYQHNRPTQVSTKLFAWMARASDRGWRPSRSVGGPHTLGSHQQVLLATNLGCILPGTCERLLCVDGANSGFRAEASTTTPIERCVCGYASF